MMNQIAEDFLVAGTVKAGILELFKILRKEWRAREDSNPRPFDPKSNALSS